MSYPHFHLYRNLDAQQATEKFCALDLSVAQQLQEFSLSQLVPEGHLRALRLKSGDHIVLVDKPGHAWELLLQGSPSRREARVSARVVAQHSAQRVHQITLVQGVSVGERMEQTVRQASELGVNRIIALQSARSTVRLDEQSGVAKIRRWQRIARSASEQSCQLFTPQIELALCLQDALAHLEDCDLLLFFWEEAGADVQPFLRDFSALLSGYAKEPSVALFIGPEGGFAPEEAALIQASGGRVACLGQTILRTETAAVVACALVLQGLSVHYGLPAD